MRKLFVVMAALLVMGAASVSAQNRLTAKVGLGIATVDDISNVDNTLNFKLGAGYEFRINNLIGIEPGAMLAMKGCGWGNDNNTTLSYIEAPVMCNFHIGKNFVVAPGLYSAILIGDDDSSAETFDFGFRSGVKYVFDNGINVGIDNTYGFSDVFEHAGGHNFTTAVFFGYSF